MDEDKLTRAYRHFYRTGWWDGFSWGVGPLMVIGMGLALVLWK